MLCLPCPPVTNSKTCDEEGCEYSRVSSKSTKCEKHGGYGECEVDDCEEFICRLGRKESLCSKHFQCDEEGCEYSRVSSKSTKCEKHGGFGECEVDDCEEFVCQRGRGSHLCSKHFFENVPKCNEEGCETILKYQVFAGSMKSQIFDRSTEDCVGLCDRHLYDYLFQSHWKVITP